MVGGAVYFGDFGGTLWKLDAQTGAVIWSHQVSDSARDVCHDLADFAKKIDNRTGKKNNGLTAQQGALITAATSRIAGEVGC